MRWYFEADFAIMNSPDQDFIIHLFADAHQTGSRSERVGFFTITRTKISFSIDFSFLLCYNINVNADLAHLVERNLAKVEVAGSIPVIRSKKFRELRSRNFFIQATGLVWNHALACMGSA